MKLASRILALAAMHHELLLLPQQGEASTGLADAVRDLTRAWRQQHGGEGQPLPTLLAYAGRVVDAAGVG